MMTCEFVDMTENTDFQNVGETYEILHMADWPMLNTKAFEKGQL